MLKSQDIRDIVRLTGETTVADLAKILGWTPARTQKELYLHGGGILTNTSPTDFKAARLLIRQTGREAGLEGGKEITRCLEPQAEDEDQPNTNLPLWKQRARFWLGSAIDHFLRLERLPLETAVVLSDMAVTQLVLGARMMHAAEADSAWADQGETVRQETVRQETARRETPRFEWRTILSQFVFPSGESLDAIEAAFLSDLHAARNDVIHGTGNFDLYRESVYIWLFLVTAIASQFEACPSLSGPGLSPFLPATSLADARVREGCADWLAKFVPTLLESALGPVTVQLNRDEGMGLADDQGRVFIPDLVIADKEGLRYSAQVEIPATLNAITAQWWAYHNPSLVFVPLGYLARARYLAKLAGYAESRLMAYISPAVDNPQS